MNYRECKLLAVLVLAGLSACYARAVFSYHQVQSAQEARKKTEQEEKKKIEDAYAQAKGPNEPAKTDDDKKIGEGNTNDAGQPTKADPPKADPPKVDPPKKDPPKKDPPKVDPPKVDPPKKDPPKVDPPKKDPPKEDPPKVDPPKKDPPKKDPQLKGDTLVLVLASKASLEREMGEQKKLTGQLLELQKELTEKNKLLGGTIYHLKRQSCQPWQPGLPLAGGESFKADDYATMFAAAFAEMEKFAAPGKAENSGFKTVLIWESNGNPDNGSQDITMPKGRTCYLCYWFTNSDQDSKKLEDWFGKENVVRPPQLENVRQYVMSLLP